MDRDILFSSAVTWEKETSKLLIIDLSIFVVRKSAISHWIAPLRGCVGNRLRLALKEVG